ncbi:MAG: mannose-1-phosphate guanylyltransferase [Hyphomonadaceae bacterium]
MGQTIIPAILAGGAGTRLWPLSTPTKPKQFHALFGARTMLQETVLRMSGEAFAPPIVLCNERHHELAAAQLGEIGVQPVALVLEPTGRNTAASACVAAFAAVKIDADALALLAPADHLLRDGAAFREAVARAAPFARERIVTFGIRPDRADTGYGYIERGETLGGGVFVIERFHEKPDHASAEAYVAGGAHFWNAGLFLFSPRILLNECAQHASEVHAAAKRAWRGASRDGAAIALDAISFAEAPALPLDIAVMEKTARGAVMPCDFGWADAGSWAEVWRLSEKDSNGNAIIGGAVTRDAADTLVHSNGARISIAGVSNAVIVATEDDIRIIPRDLAQDVKAIAESAP